MEQDIKKLLKEQSEEIKKELGEEFRRHVGILVEDFNDKVKLVSEQHISIMKVLENHTREIEKMKDELIGVNIRLDRIDDKLTRKVDYEEFQKLEKRVAVLELRK